MGIEKFFSSIRKNNISDKFIKPFNKQINTEYFYIDLNSIIYSYGHKKTQSELNYIINCIINKNYNNKFLKLINKYEIKENISLDEFKNKFTEHHVDKLIINEVINYIKNMLKHYIISKNLSLLYIAVDGVPSKSKMMTQKIRRYNGTLMSNISKKIYEKHIKDIKKHEKRYIYEENKISWNRGKITPGTEFFDKLNYKLSTNKFINELKLICPNLKKYIFSGLYEPGEGEKKIVDHLRTLKNIKRKYLIYSPDSDVILLSLLLNTEFNDSNKQRIYTLKMLRHNQQKDNYDIIDMDIFGDELYNYVFSKIGNNKLNRGKIINDIVFIYTMFGNDFLPKIESINVKYDFFEIINIYSKILILLKDKINFNYLIYYSKKIGLKKINYLFFYNLIKELQMNESERLYKVYMQTNYRNYDKIKKILDTDDINFKKDLEEFLKKLQKFNNDIKKVSTIQKLDLWLSDKPFIKIMMKLTNLNKVNDARHFIDIYYNYYEKFNITPKINILFQKFGRNIDNYFFNKKYTSRLDYLGNNVKLLDFDKEITQFENMLDEYNNKLNNNELILGKIWIDKKNYNLEYNNIFDDINKYYKHFFNIKIEKGINNTNTNKMVEKYMEGIMWVFNYYYNYFNINENREYAHTWHYRYAKAPLLKQIYYYLKKNNNLDFINKNITKKYIVERHNFFDCLEHFLYTSPPKNIKTLAPKEYINLTKNKKFYIDMDRIIDNIWKNKSNNEIDCTGEIFLSKCHFTKVIKLNINDLNFIKEIRKIKLDEEKSVLKGSRYGINKILEHEYFKTTSLDNIKNNNNKYKKKYIDNKNMNDKIKYKYFKYKFLTNK
jgi:5'-3' exonuclease